MRQNVALHMMTRLNRGLARQGLTPLWFSGTAGCGQISFFQCAGNAHKATTGANHRDRAIDWGEKFHMNFMILVVSRARTPAAALN